MCVTLMTPPCQRGFIATPPCHRGPPQPQRECRARAARVPSTETSSERNVCSEHATKFLYGDATKFLYEFLYGDYSRVSPETSSERPRRAPRRAVAVAVKPTAVARGFSSAASPPPRNLKEKGSQGGVRGRGVRGRAFRRPLTMPPLAPRPAHPPPPQDRRTAAAEAAGPSCSCPGDRIRSASVAQAGLSASGPAGPSFAEVHVSTI